ncbi:hypothetical protein V6N12_057088 [Hibiscus sabdariffa]|uniref:Uncharacterized protein n=1 Tax=Hibiscus sabdariffa TaxID=183260 RepID=A0ABR2DD40_9ROSI
MRKLTVLKLLNLNIRGLLISGKRNLNIHSFILLSRPSTLRNIKLQLGRNTFNSAYSFTRNNIHSTSNISNWVLRHNIRHGNYNLINNTSILPNRPGRLTKFTNNNLFSLLDFGNF